MVLFLLLLQLFTVLIKDDNNKILFDKSLISTYKNMKIIKTTQNTQTNNNFLYNFNNNNVKNLNHYNLINKETQTSQNKRKSDDNP
jgi:hypothetical protein